MIAGVLSAETPQHGAAVAIEVNRLIAERVVTTTATADCLAAAIVVRHQIVSVIYRIAASAYPGYR